MSRRKQQGESPDPTGRSPLVCATEPTCRLTTPAEHRNHAAALGVDVDELHRRARERIFVPLPRGSGARVDPPPPVIAAS